VIPRHRRGDDSRAGNSPNLQIPYIIQAKPKMTGESFAYYFSVQVSDTPISGGHGELSTKRLSSPGWEGDGRHGDRALEDRKGQDVVDCDGKKIGTLEDVYFEAGLRKAIFGCVKSHTLGQRHLLVPLTGASVARPRPSCLSTGPGQGRPTARARLRSHGGRAGPGGAAVDAMRIVHRTRRRANAAAEFGPDRSMGASWSRSGSRAPMRRPAWPGHAHIGR
jgi:hypothetical protein